MDVLCLFSYSTFQIDSENLVSNLWHIIKSADDLGYIIAAGSSISADQSKNSCGIDSSHAYSIISAFEIVHEGKTSQLLLMRNPWDKTTYTGEWDSNDQKWTIPEILTQVPFGLDPKSSKS